MEQKIQTCYEIIKHLDSTIYWPPLEVTQVLVDYISNANSAINHFIGRPGELKTFQKNAKDFAAFLERVDAHYADKPWPA